MYAIAAFSITSSLVFAASQERVMQVPGFTFGGFMTLVQLAIYGLGGLLECCRFPASDSFRSDHPVWLSTRFQFAEFQCAIMWSQSQ